MDLYAEMAELVAEGRSFVVATVISSGGSTPQKPGSKMVVLPDGTVRGTVGGGAIEHQIVAMAKELFQSPESTRVIDTHLTHDLGMCCGGKMSVFLERHGGAARLWIFGAGHVGKELAALAKRVGFHVTVVDERTEWANRERFPEADAVRIQHPVDVARELPGSVADYFCVTTHDHPLDQAILEVLLRKPSAYLGVIGSRRKAERFRQRLLAGGFTEAELARVRTPMGLPIRALTAEEIAVSIVGELIQVRRTPAVPSAEQHDSLAFDAPGENESEPAPSVAAHAVRR
jgi:xanthine dehydrogenase accessory factor